MNIVAESVRLSKGLSRTSIVIDNVAGIEQLLVGGADIAAQKI